MAYLDNLTDFVESYLNLWVSGLNFRFNKKQKDELFGIYSMINYLSSNKVPLDNFKILCLDRNFKRED
jgi:hypothetical protein